MSVLVNRKLPLSGNESLGRITSFSASVDGKFDLIVLALGQVVRSVRPAPGLKLAVEKAVGALLVIDLDPPGDWDTDVPARGRSDGRGTSWGRGSCGGAFENGNSRLLGFLTEALAFAVVPVALLVSCARL